MLFRSLTQAAGRAGRGEKPGEVVIQTYQPEHYSIVHAARQDYQGFYEEEITYRDFMSYPPVSHMLAVLVTSREQEQGEKLVRHMAEEIECRRKQEWQKLQVIGPTLASISKINDLYRHVFYVKHRDYQVLVEIKDILERYCKTEESKNQTVQYDFDPMNTY